MSNVLVNRDVLTESESINRLLLASKSKAESSSFHMAQRQFLCNNGETYDKRQQKQPWHATLSLAQ